MIFEQLFRYATDNIVMNIRTQPAVPYTSAPSASFGKFDFLRVEERRPAHLSYEFFSDVIASRRAMPSRVWFDLDDTLIRPREEKDPIIFQGVIVGAMRAFSEGEVPVGIFSFWRGAAIWDLIEDHAFLRDVVTHDRGIPLIRGVEHINCVAQELADPAQGVHAMFDDLGYVYFDSQSELTEDMCRAMKIIRSDEMLIDNDDVTAAYLGIACYLSGGNLERAEKLALVRAIEESMTGYLGLDDPAETPVPKYLSEPEMNRATEIFGRLEFEYGD